MENIINEIEIQMITIIRDYLNGNNEQLLKYPYLTLDRLEDIVRAFETMKRKLKSTGV